MLRFSIFARVSTSEQEDKGVSLEVQQKTLRRCVEQLNGTVVKEYIGQESATSGDKKRPILDEILNDARNKEYECLMIYDLSRLTRDPIKSKIILAELKKHGIKLYVQTQLYSLDNPETNLIVGLLAEINAFQASIQVQKSIESKIELARKGWHVFGHPPYGRKLEHNDYSKPPVWIVEPDALKKAQEIYDYYINQGIYVDKLAGMIGMSRHTIFSILKDKGVFKQTLDYNGEKMEFITPVPSLFTEEQRAIIKQRLKRNKKNNGNKYDYLLSGLVKCSKCGLHHIGLRATNTGSKYEHFYYRHSLTHFGQGCAKHVPLTLLNKAILSHITEVVSNSDTLMSIVKESNQLSSERKSQLEVQQKLIETNLATHERKRERLVKLMTEGVLDDDDVKKQLPEVKTKIEECRKSLLAIETELVSLSSLDVPEEVLKKINYIIGCFKEKFGHNISQWSFQSQRALVEWFFGTDDKNGVFVERSGKEFLYTIRSNLGTLAFGSLTDDDGGSFGVSGLGGMTLSNLPAFRSIFQQEGFTSRPDFYTRNTFDFYEPAFGYKKIALVFRGRFHQPKFGPKGLKK